MYNALLCLHITNHLCKGAKCQCCDSAPPHADSHPFFLFCLCVHSQPRSCRIPKSPVTLLLRPPPLLPHRPVFRHDLRVCFTHPSTNINPSHQEGHPPPVLYLASVAVLMKGPAQALHSVAVPPIVCRHDELLAGTATWRIFPAVAMRTWRNGDSSSRWPIAKAHLGATANHQRESMQSAYL